MYRERVEEKGKETVMYRERVGEKGRDSDVERETGRTVKRL